MSTFLLGNNVAATTDEAGNLGNPDDLLFMGFVAAASGDANEATLNSRSTGKSYKLLLYDNSDNLLSQGEVTSSVDGDNVVTLSPTVAIIGSTTYKIGIFLATSFGVRGDGSGQTWDRSETDTYPTVPDPVVKTNTIGASVDVRVFVSELVTGPTITGPATVEDGTSSTWAGTDLDTLASTGDVFLKETAIVASSKLQTYGTVTATTIPDVVNDIGQDELRDAGTSPVAGIAVTADIEASGATTAVHLLSVDDGTNPEATFATVITTETSLQTVQTMAAVAETGSGEGLFGSNLTVAENNQQCSLPKIVDGVTITLSASGDGTFTVLESELDSAGGSITFDALYYSPTTKNWSKIAITLTETGLNVGHSIVRGITKSIVRDIVRANNG